MSALSYGARALVLPSVVLALGVGCPFSDLYFALARCQQDLLEYTEEGM